MIIKPLTIGNFIIVPAGKGLPRGDQWFEPSFMDGIEDEDNYAKTTSELHSEGYWPPSAKEVKHLEAVVQKLSAVENKLDVKFDRFIQMQLQNPGFANVDENHSLTLDHAAATGNSAFTVDDIENVLFHEGAHTIYNDAAAKENLGEWIKNLRYVDDLQDFYHAEPEKFGHIVKTAFGTIDEFEKSAAVFSKHVTRALSSIVEHADFSTMTTQKMLPLMYVEPGISKTMQKLALMSDQDTTMFMELVSPFAGRSIKQRSAVRRELEKQGLNVDNHEELFEQLVGPELRKHLVKLSPSEKEQLAAVDARIMTPTHEMMRALDHFMNCYSQATEFRADDVVAVHAPKADIYSETLFKLFERRGDDISKICKETASSDTHPCLRDRQRRINNLIKRLETARDMCGELDVPAAIAAVNRECSTQSQAPKTERGR